MTREEQINEMKNVMFGKAMAKLEDFQTVDYNVFSDYEKDEFRQKIKGALNMYAVALYESGYRKEDEVQKETAMEILQKIKAFPRDLIHSYQKGAIILREAEINQIATEYGVEVEE